MNYELGGAPPPPNEMECSLQVTYLKFSSECTRNYSQSHVKKRKNSQVSMHLDLPMLGRAGYNRAGYNRAGYMPAHSRGGSRAQHPVI